MMFWIMTVGGALITLSAGLLPLKIGQTFLRHFFPEMTNEHIEHVRMWFVIAGVAILLTNAFINKEINRELRNILSATGVELEHAKAKTAELAKKLAPRYITDEQRATFIKYLASTPKGAVTIAYGSPDGETLNFVEQVRSLLKAAGFSSPESTEYAVGYTIKAPPPAFIAVVVGSGAAPAYARPIQQAFQQIGIEAIGTDGRDIAQSGELKIYIGSK